ncbi:MAG: methionyl-tRNA formyltransferase [Dehalococcoidia bacterium]
MRERCVFFGTPEFALPSLRALIDSPYEVAAVVTRPDKPAGRGRRVTSSPVKEAAEAAGLPVFQPARLREQETIELLEDLVPGFMVVAAYGLLIPPAVLELPPWNVLNVHPSLLPRHRGASPIQGAILAGDTETGVTIMAMDEGLDTGPILTQTTLPIGPNESAGELSGRLALAGASLLLEALPGWLDGELVPRPQDDALATYSPQIKAEDALIDWSLAADEIWQQVRAFNPWPGAETRLGPARLQVWRAWPLTDEPGGPPGTVMKVEDHDFPWGREPAIAVACGTGRLAFLEVQKEGRRRLPAGDFARGERDLIGARLGDATSVARLS